MCMYQCDYQLHWLVICVLNAFRWTFRLEIQSKSYFPWCGKNENGDYYDFLAIQFQVKGNFIPKLGYFLKRYLRRVTFKLNLLATIWQIWRLVGPRWPRLNCHVELNCRSLSLEVKLTKKIIAKLISVILGWKKANCMKIYDTGTVHDSYSCQGKNKNAG